VQIQISAEQVEVIRKWVVEPLFIPMLIWGYKTLKKRVNVLVTENVNRIRDELMIHLDAKIAAHESVELGFFRQFKKDMDARHQENTEKLDLIVQK
jgi:hypothetical protein